MKASFLYVCARFPDREQTHLFSVSVGSKLFLLNLATCYCLLFRKSTFSKVFKTDVIFVERFAIAQNAKKKICTDNFRWSSIYFYNRTIPRRKRFCLVSFVSFEEKSRRVARPRKFIMSCNWISPSKRETNCLDFFVTVGYMSHSCTGIFNRWDLIEFILFFALLNPKTGNTLQ